MSSLLLSRGLYPETYLSSTANFIRSCQDVDGAIRWFVNGKFDPWDHIECAMALSISGSLDEAELAYAWMREQQGDDGSWLASYFDEQPADRKETNFVAYIATGVWQHYLISQNIQFLQDMWSCVQRAIEFVLRQQTEYGDIHWAVDLGGEPMEDALRTGCSSIYKSLECAFLISRELDCRRPDWLYARAMLGACLREQPQRFDRTWDSKARYSMDWFYPVLTGVVSKIAAAAHLGKQWNTFVTPSLGCRCVSDEPWVTVAESCELVMALLYAGEHGKAVRLFSWLQRWRHADGSYWTGYQFEEQLLWPDERPSWTAAAVILAADALTEHTPAAKLFTAVSIAEEPEQARGAFSAPTT